ncbi:hypothetical protein AQUCO_07600028v1 [Aquilegia coerulea]|uniref:Uncharacterized protein n=1 Tax=Aquilegia coerulea TaxID=218851 RepID=A0A2G5C8F5_AQUCA|nr:hypothetical protein AQUCO_07600028v1 [Aquilegia coerulea]
MGLLDNLWDDTIAGPRPDKGLGKLRKYDSLPTNNNGSGSVPSSPAGSSTPGSPFSPRTPRSDMKRLSRRKTISEAFERAEPRSPTVYDWVVISALDR